MSGLPKRESAPSVTMERSLWLAGAQGDQAWVSPVHEPSQRAKGHIVRIMRYP